MHILRRLFSFLCYLLLVESAISLKSATAIATATCRRAKNVSIGVVIDESSRVGKEQKIAMKLAVRDFGAHCLNLVLHIKDSNANSPPAPASAAIDLVSHEHVDAVIGTLTPQEAALLSATTITPIISLSPAPAASTTTSYFIQMTTPITYQMQCIAAIVAHFRWRKVILLHEHGGTFSDDSALFTHLSHALQAVDSSIDSHVAVPRLTSLPDPETLIETELKKLTNKHVRLFVVAQSSLEFAAILFEKAKVLGMMERGYVWIVPDEIASLLDSVKKSVILNMQGVVGLKTVYADNTVFENKFRRRYASEYQSESEEDSNPTPSIYSLRAYDSIWTVVNSLDNSEEGKIDPTKLINDTNFQGLGGKISFKNGLLSQKPVFHIVNVIGRSYREVALWSPELGLEELSSIYWPGGEQTPPKGWSLGSREKPLRIGVPAKGAFNQFVKVTYDSGQNMTQITGFSIEVFEAAIKQLPYDLYYVLVPYFGSYDEMVGEVHNKSLDAAVGDTEIMADRYVYAEFSQPYIESGLVMVVTVKPGLKESKFIALNPFTKKMWVQLAGVSMATGAIVWLSEYAAGNDQFTTNSILQSIASILWLSVTIISFSQRENIKSTASKLVLAAWICVVFVVGASFTAVLSSMMTVPRLQPSIQEIDFLRNSNAVVGCNGNSFIVRYLINVLNFKDSNVKKINSISEYPNAFQSGEIKAAFFVAPHAKVFLAEYCNGYMISGPTYKLGGFGFVFQKGSPLAIDMSEAILKVTQSGHVDTLEKNMLHLLNCTSSSSSLSKADEIRLGPGPFSGLFLILGCILGVAFVVAVARLVRVRWGNSVRVVVQQVLIKKRNYIMWFASLLADCCTRFLREESVEEVNVAHHAELMEPNFVAVHSALNHS
ncbi:hypothetical protein C2S52_000819 [Perilla frutescens var. hirtella]|nr:hypothetical protein C2S51_007503 [Perilla frutescens var. frutescens]KAH6800355.1 hypothetical protein C2S52_000819 [Perilla frutescens var. hirtella]